MVILNMVIPCYFHHFFGTIGADPYFGVILSAVTSNPFRFDTACEGFTIPQKGWSVHTGIPEKIQQHALYRPSGVVSLAPLDLCRKELPGEVRISFEAAQALHATMYKQTTPC